MSQEKWGPDVQEVMAANLAACRHRERGSCHGGVGAGPGLIGYRSFTYYGCLLCKKDLSGEQLAFRFTHGMDLHVPLDEVAFGAWLDIKYGVQR